MIYKIDTPILLIGFNRPDVIKESFEFIRRAKPNKLYVAIDGARNNVPGERENVLKVQEIVKYVDWECETYLKFNDQNFGAEVTVSSAVSWVLESELSVIVLEDDIIAPISFLRFAQEMLTKYAHEENIYMVSGNQFTPIENYNHDYLFASSGHTWGWATWRRAWKNFDLYVDDFESYIDAEKLDILVKNKEEKKFVRRWLKRMNRKGAGNNTWDNCWSYIRFKQQGLSIIPSTNLTSNIGFFGLHARGKTVHHCRPFDESFVAKNHPEEIIHNVEYDKYHFDNYLSIRPPLYKLVTNKLINTIKNITNSTFKK